MFLATLLALLPVSGLIALGLGLKASGFLAEGFWPQAERLAYFVLLPSLFVYSLATADLSDVPVVRLASVLVGSIAVVALLLVAARRWIAADGPAFTSVFQGGIRFNNYVGLSVAGGLLGTSGVALAALANGIIVPVVNVLCIVVFARFGQERVSKAGAFRSIVTNPLVIACAVGASLQVGGLGLPPGLADILRVLGQASLPIGLLCVGAAFSPGALRRGVRAALAASGAKFVALPAITTLFCAALEIRGSAALVALIFHSLPTASSAYILARQLGGDAPLMAGIITLQTLLASIAMPLAVLATSRWL